MLHGIDPNITPDLMDCLMRMGHGDELVIVDANFPAASVAAQTLWGDAIHLPGFSAPAAIELITGLLPLDGFAQACAWRMEIDGAPEQLEPVHTEALAIIEQVKPDGAAIGRIERQAFYGRAKQAFAVVSTTESRAFGCFILRKGVIF